MPNPMVETINEVDFCAKMASAANAIFATRREHCPFVEARVEGMGSSKSTRARKDLRFYGLHNRLILTGEVKLPGNVNSFNSDLVKDAHDKAEQANVQYFFTWDVNTFVLWDRSQWQKPLLERRVNVWPLRLNLASAEELARRESLALIPRVVWGKRPKKRNGCVNRRWIACETRSSGRLETSTTTAGGF
jgi:hypothetical protein